MVGDTLELILEHGVQVALTQVAYPTATATVLLDFFSFPRVLAYKRLATHMHPFLAILCE